MVTQVELARTLGLDVSTVNKILNRRPGLRFRKETVRQVFQMAKSMGFDFNRIKHPHRRRHARATSHVPSEVLIYSRAGTLIEQGAAIIRDMSPGGALLSDVQLPSASLPIHPFLVGLRAKPPTLTSEVRGRVVRLETGSKVTLGIEFMDGPVAATV
ncbi:MAG: PilZ domain-containing protein [Planctomycetaceae bacterium]|nr:PilZ domain-containing protein [Planctomycetaceae bacterium]